MTQGLYKISCPATGWVYIGSTTHFPKRVQTHSAALRRGKGCSPALQYDYDLYGLEAFSFEFVESIADAITLKRAELELIMRLIGNVYLYNIVGVELAKTRRLQLATDEEEKAALQVFFRRHRLEHIDKQCKAASTKWKVGSHYECPAFI
jgi:hypothetical protein